MASAQIDIRELDCISFMSDWKGRKADVVVTSPPYNVGKNYRLYDDNKSYAEYLAWTETWAAGGGGAAGHCRHTC